jgi:hypothetical protein
VKRQENLRKNKQDMESAPSVVEQVQAVVVALLGGDPGSDGTLTSEPPGEKPIDGHGPSSFACSFDEDHVPATHGVFVVSLPTVPKQGGSKPGRASRCHRLPVLETAPLALPLVQPAGYLYLILS